MRLLLLSILLIWLGVGTVGASPENCPRPAGEDIVDAQFRPHILEQFISAERKTYEENDDSSAIGILKHLLESQALNAHETRSTRKLLCALEAGASHYASSASNLESALQTGPKQTVDDEVKDFAYLVRLFRQLEDRDGEARVYHLWSVCSADPAALKSELDMCGYDLHKSCWRARLEQQQNETPK